MASVLGANPFPSCSGGEWFSCTLRYCPVFTQLCQCHWTSFLPPPLIPHHIYTNLVLCLLPRPHIGQSGWYERHWLCESQETVILQFCPWAGVWRLYGAIRGRASIRAIQSMQTSKSPQSSPALGARACCQLLWLHVLCRQWSLLFDQGETEKKKYRKQPKRVAVKWLYACSSAVTFPFKALPFVLPRFKSWRRAALCLIPRKGLMENKNARNKQEAEGLLLWESLR